jgi:hypothetical protein
MNQVTIGRHYLRNTFASGTADEFRRFLYRHQGAEGARAILELIHVQKKASLLLDDPTIQLTWDWQGDRVKIEINSTVPYPNPPIPNTRDEIDDVPVG